MLKSNALLIIEDCLSMQKKIADHTISPDEVFERLGHISLMAYPYLNDDYEKDAISKLLEKNK